MAAPICIQLTPDEDAPLQQLLNDPNTHSKVRRRALAVRLAAQHWSAPRIAQFLGCHQVPVLNDLKRWQQQCYARLVDGKTHGAPQNHPSRESTPCHAARRRPPLNSHAPTGSLSHPTAGASLHADLPLEADGVCLQAHWLCTCRHITSAVEAFCSEWQQVNRGELRGRVGCCFWMRGALGCGCLERIVRRWWARCAVCRMGVVVWVV
jgi:hypothetical protein